MRPTQSGVGAFLKQSFAYTLSSWAGRFFSIISTPILTRILTPEDYGIVDFIATLEIAGFLIISLGIDAGFRRYYIDADNEADRHAYLGTGFAAWGMLNLVMVALLFFGADWVARDLLGDAGLAGIVRVAAFATLGTALMRMSSELLKDNMEVSSVAISSVLNLLVRLSLSVAFVAWLGTGVVGLYYATIIATFMTFALQVFWAKPFLGFAWSWGKLIQMARFGLPLILSRVATYLILYADRYFINFFLGLADLGLYAVGNKISGLMNLIITGFVTAWGPYVLNTYRQPEARATFRRIFRLYTTGLTLLAVGISIFSLELLFIFTTVDYIEAYTFIPYLAYSLLLYGSGYYFSVGIDITEKTYHRTWISGIILLLNPALNFLLIPDYGLIGASVATLVSYVIFCYVSLFVSEYIYPVGLAIGRSMLFQVIGAFAIVFSYASQVIAITSTQIVWKMGVMVMMFLLAIFIGLITPHEIQQVFQNIKTRLQKITRPTPNEANS